MTRNDSLMSETSDEEVDYGSPDIDAIIFVSLLVVNHREDKYYNEQFKSICPLKASSDISLIGDSILVRFSKQRLNCFRGARCLSCKSVKGLSSVG